MIHSLYSDLPKFKNLRFRHGLNILLAEKSAGASDKQTRNRAGKTSLLEVVHFLLGSSSRKDSIFRKPALQNATFGMEFDLADGVAQVERQCAKPSTVVLRQFAQDWPIQPLSKDGRATTSVEAWKTLLGRLLFGLEETSARWGPSFRSLISYFVRRDRDGGFEDPMKQSGPQQLVDQQVNVSFLIGLDWSLPQEWQGVRDRENRLRKLKESFGKGDLGPVIGSAAQLKSELIVAEDRVTRLRETIASFRVLEQYHALEREATQLTSRLSELADDNLVDRRYIAELEAGSTSNFDVEPPDLEAVYKEAGIVLPGLVRQRLEDVRSFHKSVVANRKLYLQSELEAARERVAFRETEANTLDERRASLMLILRSAGALEHFTSLQGELAKLEASAETLRQRYDAAEALESGTTKLRLERGTLQERLRRAYAEERRVIENAVLTFREISAELYEEEGAGTLTIAPTENGPVFTPYIPGEKSRGVNNMRIFCFDMMIMIISLELKRGPRFLVHDSHLYDGVDERQVGQALALAARLADKHGFQYIVTMNSDDLPKESPDEFKISEYILDTQLSDVFEDGGLFGLRFE